MAKKGISLAEEMLFSGSSRLDDSSEFFESPPACSSSPPKADLAEVCPACTKALTNYSIVQRQQHINNCLDSAANRKCLMRKHELWKQTTDCPLCGQPLNSGPFRQAHLKRCGKAHNVPPSELLRLMQVQEKIAETRRQSGLPHTKLKKPTLSSIRSETVSRGKDVPKSVFDEQVQLAQALSRSVSENEIAHMEFPAVPKSLKQSLLPTRLEMSSPKTRLSVLEGRLSDLLVRCLPYNKAGEKRSKPKYLWPSFELDGPVYSTPEEPGVIEPEEVVPERMEPENELAALQKQRIELLLADMSNLLESEVGNDVEMFCGPSFERCKAHSLILKSRCPSLLKCASERPGGRYDLFVPEITLDCMRSFLRYLYSANDEFFNSFPSDVVTGVLQRFPPSGWSPQMTDGANEQSSPEVPCGVSEKGNSDNDDYVMHQDFFSSLPNPECGTGSLPEDADIVDLTSDECEVTIANCSSLDTEACSSSLNGAGGLSAISEVGSAYFKCSEAQELSAAPEIASLLTEALSPIEQPRKEDGSAMSIFCPEAHSLTSSYSDMFERASFSAMDDLANSTAERCSQRSSKVAVRTSEDECETESTLRIDQAEVCDGSMDHDSSLPVVRTNFASPSARMSRKLVKNAVLRTPVMQRLKQQGLTVTKTVNVTPALKLAQMTTPELHTKLRRYGVRALPKRRAVKVLQRIYNETHPYVHEDGRVEVPTLEAPVIPRKRRMREDCSSKEIPPKKFDKQDVVEEYSLHRLSEKQTSLEESFLPPVPTSNSPEKKGTVSDDDNLRRLLTSDAEIYEEILTYTPLNLKNVHRRLKQEGARCSLKNLLNFLDAQCITFSMKKFDEEQ